MPIDRKYNLWGKPIVGIKPYKNPNNWPGWNEEFATLIYIGNGNTGGIVPTSWGTGDKIVATASSLVKEGYTFKDWNTNTNGTGTTYLPGSTVTINFSSITLYAIWNLVSNYVLSYNANGATGSVPGSVNAGANTIVATNGNLSKTLRYVSNGRMTNQNLTFLGWNTMSDSTGVTYSAGSTITISSNNTLYAIWETPHTYTITYDGNGNTSASFDGQGYGTPGYGSGDGTIEAVQTYAWDAVTKITPGGIFRKDDPTYTNFYQFMEWNTNADGTGESFYDLPNANYVAYNRDITLYAIWTEVRYIRFVTYMVGQNVQQSSANGISYIDEDGVYYSDIIHGVGINTKYSSLYTSSYYGSPANDKFDITPVYDNNLRNSLGLMNRDFSRPGLSLLGWNTKADGSGTFYAVGSNIYNQNRELVVVPQLNNEWGNVLYAIWG